jgi:YD repeat-containing protein
MAGMTFDDNGNLLTQTDPSGTLTYTWDARNRLTALTGPSLIASFAYDGLGRRAQRRSTAWGPSSTTTGWTR